MNKIIFGDFVIDAKSPVIIIAELSANHNGSLDNAIATIKAAKRAGANAIKLQTYTADTLTIDVKSDDFKVRQGTIWDGKYLHGLYQEAYTPWEWHGTLFQVAKDEGLLCFSSPFDNAAVDLLEQLDAPGYKIASFEITDIPLIEYVASKGKPVIISTGIAEEADIALAVGACRKQGNSQIALLKCTSSYPAPINEANMIMVKDMAERFDVITGLSDHTMSLAVPIVATTFGAKIIEKHFILDRAMGGVDSAFSLDEAEFSQMVKSVREAEAAIGEVNYNLTPKQRVGKEFCRSLYITNDMKKGDIVTTDNVRSIRPGFGLHPKYYPQVLGKRASRDLAKGTRAQLEYFV